MFCFETSTTERKGGEKGGSANSKTKHAEPFDIIKNFIPVHEHLAEPSSLGGGGVLEEPGGVPERAGQLEVAVGLRPDGLVVRRHLLPHTHAPLHFHM